MNADIAALTCPVPVAIKKRLAGHETEEEDEFMSDKNHIVQ